MQASDFRDHPVVAALDDTIRTLTALREQGLKSVQVSPEVWQRFCQAPAAAAAAPAPTLPAIPTPTQLAANRTAPGGGDTPAQREQALAAFRRELSACKGCRYACEGRFAGRGNSYNPAVAIVAAPPLLGEDAAAQGARLEEGSEAWTLLGKMFAAIHLPLQSLYLTPAMKCAVPRGRVEAAALRTCGEQLKRELRLVNPRAVVLLGPVAAQALFSDSLAGAGAVGRWHMLLDLHLPAITLHHPMRLIMLGETMARSLKLENWNALKSLQQRLSQPHAKERG